jgi:hypothetical protein
MAPLVEARRDGRVGERESASLDRHLITCASCRGLNADLERMADFAGRPSAPSLSPLEQRRERLRLLRDAAFIPASFAGTRSRVQLVRFAAAAAMILGVLAGGTALAVLGLPSAKADAPGAESMSAKAPAPTARLLVAVPYAATIAAPVVEAPPASAAAIAEEPAPVIPTPPAPRPAPPHGKKIGPASTAVAGAAEAPNDGASALADGVELIERGDYGAAADRLRAFRQSHPTDVRSEDAAFLSVLALERAGRHAAAVGAARDYLASYPRGYRRAEAQAIIAAP